MMHARHLFSAFAAILFLFGQSSLAQSLAPPTADAKPTNEMPAATPDVMVQMGVQKLITFVTAQPKPERKDIAAFLDQEISPFFDWHYMARLASGRMYRNLNQYQRNAMADDIKRRFLTQMTERMTQWGVYDIQFLPTRVAPSGNMAVVGIQFMEPRRLRPAQIDLYLQLDNYGWAIVDIVANGVSAISYYRDQLLIEARYQNYYRRRQ